DEDCMRSLYFFFCVSLWSTQPWLLAAPRAEADSKIGCFTHFEPTRGQVKGRTEWMAQARGASMYITGPEVVFALGNDNAHMRFVGASRKSKGAGNEPLGAYSNYFI